MKKLNLYRIPLLDAIQGVQHYEYNLDNQFFELMEDALGINGGQLEAKVELSQVSHEYKFMFKIDGTVQVSCDLCLADMDCEVHTQNNLLLKEGEEYMEISEEIQVIPYGERYIDIAQYLFEFIVLSLPLTHKHKEGECDEDVYSKFQEYKTEIISDDDDDDDEFDFDLDDED